MATEEEIESWGTDPDAAYAEAERLIADAERTSATALDFSASGSALFALAALPASIAALSSLQTLDLNDSQVADLAPIAALSSLLELYLDNTQVANLAPIAALSSLQRLDLENTQVANLAPIAALSSLRALTLDNTQVADLAPIAALSSLERLDLDNTQVADLTPIAELSNLQTLALSGTRVADLAPIAALSSLQTLFLNNTQVTDLAPIAEFSRLQTLTLSNTQVTDLAPIAELSSLKELYFSNTQVTDLAPIAEFSSLQTLLLNSTQVADLAPIRNLDALIEGAKEFSFQGLHFKGALATRGDKALLALSKLENPERTIQTLQYLKGEHREYGGPPEKNGEPPKVDKPTTLNELLNRPTAKVVIRLGKLDLDPVEPDDEPENADDRELSTLPERQQLAAERLISALGQNQSATRTALKQYADHIAPSGAVLEILREAMETAEAGMAQAAREKTIDDDVAQAWNRFCLNDTTFFANYPLDAERDALYRRAEVDWEEALGKNFANAFAQFRDAIKDQDHREAIGETLLNWAEVSTAYSEVLTTEHFNRGSALPPLTDETDGPAGQIEGSSTPLKERVKRQVGQGTVVAKQMIDTLDSDAGKRVKNSAWLLGHAQKLWDMLSNLF